VRATQRYVSSDLHRRFQKTGQITTRSVFMMDLMGQGPDVNSIPHFRDKGLNVLYTDNSVKFNKTPAVWSLVAAGKPDTTVELDTICNLIEQSP
jgi:hypothetical protein